MSAPGAAPGTGTEVPVTFTCAGATLVGVLHRPPKAAPRGVVVVVGAPQYRVGSHRQFVLLARALCTAGFPVLRFDYRGMGDSDGEFQGFEDVGRDIDAAVHCLLDRVAGLEEVVLWGLCDGASAASFYAANDPRIAGLIVLNPWVRSGQTLARARLSGYYLQRLMSREFWAKALGGKLDPVTSLRELAASAATVLSGRRPTDEAATVAPVYSPARAGAADLPQRVGDSLRRFAKPTLVILSGADMTAQEFRGSVADSGAMRAWRNRPEVTLHVLPGANHTYASAAWRAQVHAWSIEWLRRS